MSFLCNTFVTDILPRLASSSCKHLFQFYSPDHSNCFSRWEKHFAANWYSHLNKSLATLYKQQYLNLSKWKYLLHLQSHWVCLGSISSVPHYVTPKGHQWRVIKQRKPLHSWDTIGHEITPNCSKCILWSFTPVTPKKPHLALSFNNQTAVINQWVI